MSDIPNENFQVEIQEQSDYMKKPIEQLTLDELDKRIEHNHAQIRLS